MARTRRRGRAGRPAGPFATAVKGGRALSWESLSVAVIHNALTAQFPVVSFVGATTTTQYRVLTPGNVTRGVITVLRIRGRMNTLWNIAFLNAAGGLGELAVSYQIQLVPLRSGLIADGAVLNPRNGADLESNRILWRYTAYPNMASDPAGIDFGGTRFYGESKEIDVKVKRRYDVSEWALVMVVEFDTVDIAQVQASIDLRGLYLATDGV